MQNTRSYQLIAGIMNHQPIRWPENQTDNDHTLFIESAQQHGVLALLSQFQDQPDTDNWPALIRQSISIANKAAEKILQDRKRLVISVFDVFAKRNIDALIFKGAANAYLLYTQPHQRAHADIDILIRETDFKIVKNCLSTLGFEFDNIKPTKYGPSQSSATLKEADKTPINLDIHWKVNNRLALANTLEFDELNRRAVPVEQYDDKARAFSLNDAVLIACIHEAGSLDSEKGKLISLFDVYLLLQKLDTPELEVLTTMAMEKKISAIYRHYLNHCLNTFDNPTLANRIRKVLSDCKFQKNELSAKLLTGNRSWASNQWLDLHSVNGVFAKLEFIFSKLKRKLC